MKKSVPKMHRLLLPAVLCCLPLQPLFAAAAGNVAEQAAQPVAGPVAGLQPGAVIPLTCAA